MKIQDASGTNQHSLYKQILLEFFKMPNFVRCQLNAHKYVFLSLYRPKKKNGRLTRKVPISLKMQLTCSRLYYPIFLCVEIEDRSENFNFVFGRLKIQMPTTLWVTQPSLVQTNFFAPKKRLTWNKAVCIVKNAECIKIKCLKMVVGGGKTQPN